MDIYSLHIQQSYICDIFTCGGATMCTCCKGILVLWFVYILQCMMYDDDVPIDAGEHVCLNAFKIDLEVIFLIDLPDAHRDCCVFIYEECVFLCIWFILFTGY